MRPQGRATGEQEEVGAEQKEPPAEEEEEEEEEEVDLTSPEAEDRTWAKFHSVLGEKFCS